MARKEGLALNPGEITLALFGRHLSARFVEVLEHGGFAFGAKPGSLVKRLFNRGIHCVCGCEQLLDFCILLVNTSAHFSAFGEISVMQPRDLGELIVGEFVFLFEPGQFGIWSFYARTVRGYDRQINTGVSDARCEQSSEDDQ